MRGKKKSRRLIIQAKDVSSLHQNGSSKGFENECNLKVLAKALPDRLDVRYKLNG